MTPHMDQIRAFYSKEVFIHHLPSKAIPSFCIQICIHFVFILPNLESQNVRKYFQYIGAVYRLVDYNCSTLVLGGFAVGTKIRGISLFPLVPSTTLRVDSRLVHFGLSHKKPTEAHKPSVLVTTQESSDRRIPLH